MFGAFSESSAPHVTEHRDVRPWTRLQSLQAERDTLGLYLTGHPVELQAEDIARFTTCTLNSVADRMPAKSKRSRAGTPMVLAGLVQAVRRRGNRGGFVALEDHTGRIEAAMFDDTWTLYADLLNKDEIIVVEGRVAKDNFSGGFRMNAQKIMTLSDAKSRFARGVQISLRGPDDNICASLQSTFIPYQNGSGQVWLNYSNSRARARLELGEEWNVNACEELVAALGELEMVSDARLVY
jgi:DNA polymerase-3 subunit alpha